MKNATEIEVKEQVEVSVEEDKTVDLYGYGNESLKTWFISKTKKQIMPKGSRLLFLIKASTTNNPIHTTGTFPHEGDVICTTTGQRHLVKSVQWV
jgi:hypothetical protein